MKKIILLTAVLFLSLSRPLWAQIFAEQGKVVQQIAPGQTFTGEFLVHNTSGQAVQVRAYWEDFRYEPPYDGSKKFFPPGTVDNSCSQWVNFAPKEFSLPPFGKQKISYTVNPPPTAKGGFYGVLFFEREGQDTKTSTGLRIITRVGTLFFLETADKAKKAAIEDVKLEDNLLKAQLSNIGDVILILTGTYYVLDQQNMAVDRGEIASLYLPPSQRGEFQVNLKKDLPGGRYTVVVTFDLQEGRSLVKEIDFEKTPSAQYQILKTRD